MTEVKDSISAREDHSLKVLLIPEGRKLYFQKECLEAVTIQRKVNDGYWEVISKNTRTPYVDGDQFKVPVTLAYKAIYEKQGRQEDVVEVHLN